MSELNIKEIYQINACNCVAVKGDMIYTSNLKGVMPILSKLIEDTSFFAGTTVGDNIIGKAAAMLLIYGKAERIYAKVLSEAAIPYLEKFNIQFSYDTLVPYIMNRNRDGMCPMEQLVSNIEVPEEAFHAICNKIKGA